MSLLLNNLLLLLSFFKMQVMHMIICLFSNISRSRIITTDDEITQRWFLVLPHSCIISLWIDRISEAKSLWAPCNLIEPGERIWCSEMLEKQKPHGFQHYLLRTFSPTIPFHLSYASHAEIKSGDLTVTPTLLFNLWHTSAAHGCVGVTCTGEIKSCHLWVVKTTWKYPTNGNEDSRLVKRIIQQSVSKTSMRLCSMFSAR